MTDSMTGFASRKGAEHGYSWEMDVRAVNARGLDIRLRVPDWVEGLEADLRRAVQQSVTRGSVTLSIKVQADSSVDAMAINDAGLDHALENLKAVQDRAAVLHTQINPPTAAEILQMRGVTEVARAQVDTAPLRATLLREAGAMLEDFKTMRRSEGDSLNAVLAAQLAQIESLTADAAKAAEDRKEAMAQGLRDALARVLANADGADPDRVAQELALIAVKADVTEEIDRLAAHVEAARALLQSDGPVGRKLDFLTQEFNREANTLCSKAQSKALTGIGLDLKAVIDQMREQVQNVE